MVGKTILTSKDFNVGDVFIIKAKIYYKKVFTVKSVDGNGITCEDNGDIYCFPNESFLTYSPLVEFKSRKIDKAELKE